MVIGKDPEYCVAQRDPTMLDNVIVKRGDYS